MKSFGRSLQFFALTLLPLAVLMELSGALGREHSVSDMLVMLLFGTAAFGIGRIVESYASR